ncbi:MAG TPA: ABC transporter permease subunit [Acidimicrobiales bacterium]|jgi:NitT/TauT family transport system permease protein|nr:ABC transporter permease subunit [Actinomycetes bacterium]MDP6104753.1 ABC transporter permease subunit [Acidimicrobiales bacterium]MCP4846025.1 ABC transporter permease subunit [Actinomycetes bacterium]MDP6239698.1 ABC transporter permease subunit [Acidimicrobiales bacterium]MDP7124396.1 ABC transporter permease subunit [Acidimicrobiales bacterium]|tara:strand:- start:4327 stop:5169 length:843 start_codon:yes stop_codon:yes gene_type:complete
MLATAFAAVVLVVLLWEGYKWVGQQTGDRVPGTDIELLVDTDDLTMPHAKDILGEFVVDVRDGRSTLPMSLYLLKKAWFTLQEAAIGFFLGLVVGLALAVLMLRWRVVERGLLPWINVSQTVPLIALAPIIVTWGRLNDLPDLLSISLIAAYLTFFPVAVSALRGLQSPNAADVELMRSYAASWRTTLFKLRLPAARAYLFPAFKIAATLSVVGAIVGEISIGTKTGLGRAILEFAQRYAVFPERLYASVIGAAALGLSVFGLITLAERMFVGRTREAST